MIVRGADGMPRLKAGDEEDEEGDGWGGFDD
jgi:hypothetical protein